MYGWHRLASLNIAGLARFRGLSSVKRCIFRGEKGVIERLAACCDHAPFAVVAALAGLCASLASFPKDSVKSVSIASVEIMATARLPRPIMYLVEVRINSGNFKKTNLKPRQGLPGVPPASAPSLALSQITPQSVYLSLLTPAQHPLRC